MKALEVSIFDHRAVIRHLLTGEPHNYLRIPCTKWQYPRKLWGLLQHLALPPERVELNIYYWQVWLIIYCSLNRTDKPEQSLTLVQYWYVVRLQQ